MNKSSLAGITLMLLAGACTSGSTAAPTMTLNQAVVALTTMPTLASTPLCELKLKRWDDAKHPDWYTCKITPEAYGILPISGLDEDDFWKVGGITREAHFREIHGASHELPALDPTSPAYRLGWREGDRLTGLARMSDTLIANLERDGEMIVMLYTVE